MATSLRIRLHSDELFVRPTPSSVALLGECIIGAASASSCSRRSDHLVIVHSERSEQ
jgi:hypothetical protein